MVGACCYELGLPLLMDSMQSRGVSLAAIELDAHQQELKEKNIWKEHKWLLDSRKREYPASGSTVL